MFRFIWTAVFVLLLCACGGGGSTVIGTAPGNGGGTGAVQTQGIWTGSFTITGSPSTTIFAVVPPTGFATFFTQDGILYVLPLFTGGGTLDGKLLAIAPTGVTFPNGQSQETFSLTATVSSTEITGSFSGNGETGSFTLMPATPFTGNPSIVAGNWQGFILGSSAAAAITVQAGGSFVGHDADGCTLNGTITQLQAAQDLFSVSLDSTGTVCPGHLTGLAFESNLDLGGVFGGTTGIYYYLSVSNASGGFVAELKLQ